VLAALRAKPAPAAPPPDIAQLIARGLTCAAIGLDQLALELLQEATTLAPDAASQATWRALAHLLRQTGAYRQASEAAAQARVAKPAPPVPHQPPARFTQAEQKMLAQLRRFAPRPAIAQLRDHLLANPNDAAALRLLAEHLRAQGDDAMAAASLRRALDLAPDYISARHDYAHLLLNRGQPAQALPHMDKVLTHRPKDQNFLRLRASALSLIGDHAKAITIYDLIIKTNTVREANFWLTYARSLHYAGRRAESVRAYRHCIERAPTSGEAYLGIANLKYEPLTEADLATIARHLTNPALNFRDRFHMHYTMGYAFEKSGDYAESFKHYAAGAAIRTTRLAELGTPYRADDLSVSIAEQKTFFTAGRLATHATPPASGPTPIFVLGMPRSGSTLVEQILASHSLIEGTQELPELSHIARGIADDDRQGAGFPNCYAIYSAADLAELGADYLGAAQIYRKTARPFFIDKMPANWIHTGLIQLILPHAKIIDTRRDPMSCCFSMFKQMIATGAEYTYNLTDLGRYYNDYVDLMTHFDAVAPGRVHRVNYERMVDDTEAEIRRLLAYCGVPFEPQCLRFWETNRAVATPSAEQVRRPIFRDAVEQWRNYEPWLGELKAALGKSNITHLPMTKARFSA
jgi:tetratricopeptide (TPR) repeat protein